MNNEAGDRWIPGLGLRSRYLAKSSWDLKTQSFVAGS